MEPTYKRVYKNFVNHVSKGNVQIETTFDVLKSLVYIMDDYNSLSGQEKKMIVIQTLEDIVSGEDGILYTEDDILSPDIVQGIKILIETDMISSTIDFVCEVTHLKTGWNLSMYICHWIGFLFCGCCKRRPRRINEPLLRPPPVGPILSHPVLEYSSSE